MHTNGIWAKFSRLGYGRTLVPASLGLLVAVSGCGSSGGGKTTSAAASAAAKASSKTIPRRAHAPHHATVKVTSAAVTPAGGLVLRYSCRGADISPALHWILPEGAEAKTKEILVFVRTIAEKTVLTNWAVAGIAPNVDHLEAGKLPAGAIVGRNSFGKTDYHLCPKTEAIVTMGVYALPRTVSVARGFEPETLRGELEDPSVQWGGAELFYH